MTYRVKCVLYTEGKGMGGKHSTNAKHEEFGDIRQKIPSEFMTSISINET